MAAMALSAGLHAALFAVLRFPVSPPPSISAGGPLEEVRLLDISSFPDFPSEERPSVPLVAPVEGESRVRAPSSDPPDGAPAHVAPAANPEISGETRLPEGRRNAVDLLRGGLRDPRLLAAPSPSSQSPPEPSTPAARMGPRMDSRIQALNDSLAVAAEIEWKRNSIQVGSYRIRILRSADDFVDIDPTWVKIRDQEAERERREGFRERVEATRARRDAERGKSAQPSVPPRKAQ